MDRAPANDRKRVVIVGAGFGGLTAAQALRKAPLDITIVDRRNHHLFQPLLYQVATAGLSPADIASPVRAIVRRHGNTRVVLGELTAVDLNAKCLRFRDPLGPTELPYDFLIVATGAEHSYFGHPEWESIAPGLKGVEEAVRIRRLVLTAFEVAEAGTSDTQAWLTFVIVGAGPTGVEVAGALAELARRALARDFRRVNPASARILLVEAGPRILPTFPAQLAASARRALEKLGVEVREGTAVERIEPSQVRIGTELVRAHTVVWAAGVKASPAAQWLNVPPDKAGRVQVAEDCSLPGHPEVFVIGDTARFEVDGHPLPGVAPVAMQQGRYVAKQILARATGGATPGPFEYVDKGNLATVGRGFAIGTFGKLHLSGWLAWIVWAMVHVYYLISFRNKVLVLLQWAWAYVTYQRGARLIVWEPPAEGRAPRLSPGEQKRTSLPDARVSVH